MIHYPNIVILTGAGISAESGIKTFRASDGLWEEHRIEDVATPEALERNPQLVQRFYNERRRPLLDKEVHPNAAHYALAELEASYPGEVLLVTQNIDNLHEQAGSTKVLHMHGEVLKKRCTSCQQVSDCLADIEVDDQCDRCGGVGTLRPHIVWFGEMPLYMDTIYSALAECGIFAAIGTSGNVYPAAGFVQVAKQSGAQTIELNLEESMVASEFADHLLGNAGDVVPKWVATLLEHA